MANKRIIACDHVLYINKGMHTVIYSLFELTNRTIEDIKEERPFQIALSMHA